VTLFRPCIDLHEGKVKQIVGGSLTEHGARENFVSSNDAAWFANKYAQDALAGGHIILLGAGNEAPATAALLAFPGGLQLGGGVTPHNARRWLDLGASHVIVTSFLFEGDVFSERRLDQMLAVVSPQELVIDLSCRKVQTGGYRVTTERWQTISRTAVDEALVTSLEGRCAEFLVHAADVEGLCQGVDAELVALLGSVSNLPCTYAGGASSLNDLALVERLSSGRLDLTYGSALDLFGGHQVRYDECLEWNRARKLTQPSAPS